VRPLNQGLESLGSATNFEHYIETIYKPVVKPLMATTSFDRTRGVLDNYLIPAFGNCCLRDLTALTLQTYFSKLTTSTTKQTLSHESRDKIRDVLSSALRFAVQHDLLVRNPAESLRIPPDKRGKKRNKPYLTPQQFDLLVGMIPEPYASMVYVAIYTGLRVSELAGLRWNDIGASSITIDERFCRGDWEAPKSEASNATIGVNSCVIDRIHRLKGLTVEVRAGNAIRKYKVAKSDGASRGFWGPPPALPMLDSVKAESKHARKFRLWHAQSSADCFHVNILGDVCLESSLLPSKKSLNVVKTIHHLLELRFHAISSRYRKYYRASLARCVLPSTGFLSHSLGKQR
jgi:hypothetical protein